MRTRTLGVVTVGFLLGAWSGAPAALAGQDASAKGDRRELSLTGRFTDHHRADRGRPGWSEGDEISFEFDLFRHHELAGDGDGLCTISRYDRLTRNYTADCTATFNLDTGTLDLAGEVTDDDFRTREITMDVVGGSRGFQDARGTATFTRAGPTGPPGRHTGGPEDNPRRDFRVDVDLE